jgi:hypothetical protein
VADASESSTESTSPWEQGSLLPESATVPPLQWVHPDSPATKTAKGAVTNARRRAEVTEPLSVAGPGKQGDRMMVISQSCDIIKPAGELPQVEVARVFSTDKPRTIAQAQDFGSARYFRVNAPAEPVAAILDYGQRALLDKGFLSAVEPDNTLLDAFTEEQRRTLAAWLGRRYSRPAVPDEDYPVITGPVREAWKQLVETDAETAQRFNREYTEWRYRREDDGSLTIYILALSDEPDAMTALEVSDFLTQTLGPVYPGPVNVATNKRSYATFTKADELSTEMIDMEWASRDEEADDAALPE